MSRIIDRLLVLVYVALAALPIIAMRMGCNDRELHGSLPPAPLPEMTLPGVLSEDVQHGIAAWFESNLGLKGTSISFDNALLYHVFGETKPGAGVRLGKDRVLFSNEDLDYYNKNGRWLTDPAYVNKLADQIADVQRRMRAQHKALVPVLIPAKTSIWRDKAPDAWAMNLPLPRASDETTRMITQALLLRGVTFVNARELFTTSEVPRADLFGPDARHWSSYGACLTMSRVFDAQAQLLGEPRLPHHCVFERRRVPRSHDDFDLWRLLNAVWVYPAVKQVPAAHHTPPPTPLRRGALFVGTSFCWQIMRDLQESGLFRRARLNYYNQTFADAEGGEREPVEGGSARWRELTMNNELVVLDLFESYLGLPEAYVQLFLDDMTRELDAQP